MKAIIVLFAAVLGGCCGEVSVPDPTPIVVPPPPVPHCDEGASFCTGTFISTCTAGHWSDYFACPYACVATECTGVCVPGSTKIDCNGTHICTETGSWDPIGASCPLDQ